MKKSCIDFRPNEVDPKSNRPFPARAFRFSLKPSWNKNRQLGRSRIFFLKELERSAWKTVFFFFPFTPKTSTARFARASSEACEREKIAGFLPTRQIRKHRDRRVGGAGAEAEATRRKSRRARLHSIRPRSRAPSDGRTMRKKIEGKKNIFFFFSQGVFNIILIINIVRSSVRSPSRRGLARKIAVHRPVDRHRNTSRAAESHYRPAARTSARRVKPSHE